VVIMWEKRKGYEILVHKCETQISLWGLVFKREDNINMDFR
jgi:hypothetical protein